jgi:outer membrane lipoprotein carrier protein
MTIQFIYKTPCLALLVLLLFPFVGAAQEAPASGDMAAATQLAAILSDTRTLQADVSQLTLDQDGREIQEFEARIILSKPDHFSWEIISPYNELLLADGKRIWRYEPDLEQVTIEPFSDDLERTPALLLNGDAKAIAESYSISSADMDFGSKVRFILHPKSPDSLFERLSLTFSGHILEEMQFEDSLGQKTSLTFSNLVANEPIAPDVFIFHVPEGLEVLDNTGG